MSQIENEAAQSATNTERARIKDIEDMTTAGAEASAYDAKYGEKPMDAAAYAIAQMKAQKAAGKKAVQDAQDDADESGANAVGQAAPASNHQDNGEKSILDAIHAVNKVK